MLYICVVCDHERDRDDFDDSDDHDDDEDSDEDVSIVSVYSVFTFDLMERKCILISTSTKEMEPNHVYFQAPY